jgi:hypothetical protein
MWTKLVKRVDNWRQNKVDLLKKVSKTIVLFDEV